MVDEPEHRAEIDAGLQDVYEATGWHNPIPIKKACELLGLCSGRLRLPLLEADDERTEIAARRAGRPRSADHRMSQQIRVLPLGGLGEIGKNMTVVEIDDRILVVDVGLRFPTAEMMGIDLVLPDFTYLRSRVDDIEGIVVTHGHEDHLGCLPVPPARAGRRHPRLRRQADDGDGALEARRAPLQGRPGQRRRARRGAQARARSTSS